MPVQGQVLCLAAAMDYLFSGGQDTTIRVWKFNAATSKFDPAVKPWYLFPVSDGPVVVPSQYLRLPKIVGKVVVPCMAQVGMDCMSRAALELV